MTRERVVDAATTLASLAVVIGAGWLLGLAVGHPGIDRSVTDWVVEHRNGALDGLAPHVSDLASPAMYVSLTVVAVAVLWREGPRVASAPVVALFGVRIVSSSVKELVGKARPPVAQQLVAEHGFAFPSGHTITAMGVWGAAALLLGGRASGLARGAIYAIGALVVLGVGLSRIYLGVHWCTDVVVGWALGAAWLAIVVRRARA